MHTCPPACHPQDSSEPPWRPCTSCLGQGTVHLQGGRVSTEFALCCHLLGTGTPPPQRPRYQHTPPW